MTNLTKHIITLAKDNFIKIDDQQKVLQIVREALLLNAEKEIIICAAVKAKNGQIIRCHRHSDGFRSLREMNMDYLRGEAS